MCLRTLRWLLPAGLLLSVSSAHAQPTPGAAPAAPENTVSSYQYISIFTQYHPFKEQPLLPWREANDIVGEIGGWRFYAKEAQQADKAEKPAGLPTNIDPHSGHGGKP